MAKISKPRDPKIKTKKDNSFNTLIKDAAKMPRPIKPKKADKLKAAAKARVKKNEAKAKAKENEKAKITKFKSEVKKYEDKGYEYTGNIKDEKNLGTLRGHMVFTVDRIKYAGQTEGNSIAEAVESNLTASNLATDKGLARYVNNAITTKVPVMSWDKDEKKHVMKMEHISTRLETNILKDIIDALDLPAEAGEDNEYFTIDEDYDKDKLADLGKHITFKKLPIGNDKIVSLIETDLAEVIYDNRKLWDYVEEQNMETIMDDLGKKMFGGDTQAFTTFKEILDTSYLWYIAQQRFPPSEAVRQEFENLTKLSMEAHKKNQEEFRKVVTMIKNGEDVDEIITALNNVIAGLKKDGQPSDKAI